MLISSTFLFSYHTPISRRARLGELEAAGSNATEDYMCMEAGIVDSIAFQSSSDVATLNGARGVVRLATK